MASNDTQGSIFIDSLGRILLSGFLGGVGRLKLYSNKVFILQPTEIDCGYTTITTGDDLSVISKHVEDCVKIFRQGFFGFVHLTGQECFATGEIVDGSNTCSGNVQTLYSIDKRICPNPDNYIVSSGHNEGCFGECTEMTFCQEHTRQLREIFNKYFYLCTASLIEDRYRLSSKRLSRSFGSSSSSLSSSSSPLSSCSSLSDTSSVVRIPDYIRTYSVYEGIRASIFRDPQTQLEVLDQYKRMPCCGKYLSMFDDDEEIFMKK